MTVAPESNSSEEPVITITRVFDAPRELVFKAWTDPAQMAQWFAPHGFTVPLCEVDLRIGGKVRIDMQGPDGSIYPNNGSYLELDPPKRLVVTDDVDPDETAWGEGGAPPSSVQSVTFEELDGKTKVIVQMRFASIAARDASKEMGVEAGYGECFDKLDSLLAIR